MPASGLKSAPKALLSWSSGKDSAFALWQSQRRGDFEIVGLLTTVTQNYQRVSMHGVREALLDLQLQALGLPGFKVYIPSPCSNELYEEAMAKTLADIRARGIRDILFGDLFLPDIREYREQKLKTVGMRAHFPLWGQDTKTLAPAMIDAGLRATVACLDPRKVPPALAGRPFDRAFLSDLPDEVDPCGEHGEFHTFVHAAPNFRQPIHIEVGTVVEREGFVFADLLPASQAD